MGATCAYSTDKITVIKPTITLGTKEDILKPRRMRVAAYARVSTDDDEQLTSYAAQCDYYEKKIKNTPEWDFAGLYSDEGITGTNTKKRDGFNRMIADAKDGRIDIILIKSVSRFARNTVDVLKTVRELREHGTEVWFEKENINTKDPQCETILTIMGSLAQEESRSISDNVRWGIRKSMMDGKVRIPYGNFMGYRKGKDGNPEIVEEEAKIIKDIYKWFLEGKTISGIARKLTNLGIKTPKGSDIWSISTVDSILRNEKYKGDALLQKTFTVDFLSKRMKKNEGEVEQFYVRGSHPAIIDPEIFDLVQYELDKRSAYRSKLHDNSALTTRIICGDCGSFYGHKVFRARTYRYDAWCCNNKTRNNAECTGPNIKQWDIYDYFAKTLAAAIAADGGRELDEEAYRSRVAKLKEDRILAAQAMQMATDNLRDYVEANSKKVKDQEAFLKEHERLTEIMNLKTAAFDKTQEAIIAETAKYVKKKIFIEATEGLSVENIRYSDDLFVKTVDHILVKHTKDGHVMEFHFTNGEIITADWRKP